MSPVTLRSDIGVRDSMTVRKTPDLTYGGTVGINGSDTGLPPERVFAVLKKINLRFTLGFFALENTNQNPALCFALNMSSWFRPIQRGHS